MAEAARTTTPRTRTRTAAPKPAETAAKAAPAPKADVAAVTRFTVTLDNAGESASYAKFAMPENLKGTAVGTLYLPKGTKAVKVLVIGDDDTEVTE